MAKKKKTKASSAQQVNDLAEKLTANATLQEGEMPEIPEWNKDADKKYDPANETPTGKKINVSIDEDAGRLIFSNLNNPSEVYAVVLLNDLETQDFVKIANGLLRYAKQYGNRSKSLFTL